MHRVLRLNRVRRIAGERGSAMLETALTLPLLLLVSVGIFEFGRAYQTWQVVTNAAREGARYAVTPSATPSGVQTLVKQYLQNGQLSGYAAATVSVNPNATMNIGAASVKASVVTVNYPFSFAVLNPVARLVVRGSSLGSAPITLVTSAEMRNESQ